MNNKCVICFLYTTIIFNVLINLGYLSCGVICLDSYTSSHIISLLFLLNVIALFFICTVFYILNLFEKMRVYFKVKRMIWNVLFIIANVEIFGMIVYDVILILLGIVDELVFMYDIVLIVFGGIYFGLGVLANQLLMKAVNITKNNFLNLNERGEVLGASFKETTPGQDINTLYPGLDNVN